MSFQLRLTPREVPADEDVGLDARVHAMTTTILLVDDDREQVTITRRILEKTGQAYRVDSAADAAEGIQKICRREYDVVLCDYRLPGLSGLELLKQIKENGKDLPFIIVTAAGNEHIAVEAMKNGAYDYVVKDAAYNTILPGVIRQALERYWEKQERQRLEAEGKRAEEDLRQTLSDLKRSHGELKDTQLQLIEAEKLESIGRLAAGVAHEVKNPLATIMSGVEYLCERLGTDDVNLTTLLQDMQEAVTRANAVIMGLVDFSAPTRLHREPGELNSIVEKSLLLVRHELTSSHISVVRALGDTLGQLQLDRNKMQQVFVNLVMNAIQAMPAGGTLTVRTYRTKLTDVGPNVGSRMTDRFKMGEIVVAADVEDTGTGVRGGDVVKVFDPFFTTKPTGKGTGLGLSVSRKIVDLHGGTIDLRNRTDGGVTVTVMLSTKGGNGR